MAIPPTAAAPIEPRQADAQKSPGDRSLAGLLLAFFLGLYLLTGSGHGYSPDGEFAFRIARFLIVERDQGVWVLLASRLSHWGFVVPVLAQPLVLLGESVADAMPQRDSIQVDGRSVTLGYFRAKGLPDQAPTVGSEAGGDRGGYGREDLPAGSYTALSLVSFLTEARQIPQGTVVARILLTDAGGDSIALPLRAGVETAEWNLVRDGTGARHGPARVASVWSGNFAGRNYHALLPFERALEPRELQIHYLLPEGRLYVRSLELLDGEGRVYRPLESDQRFWSDRENRAYFLRLFYSPYNAIVSALGCLLVFALARILGYGRRVSVATTLLYGLATLAWPYSKYDFSEPTLALFVLASLYLIFRWGRERKDRLLLMAGVAALMAVGTKYASGAVVPFLLIQIVLLHWEKRPSVRGLPAVLRPVLLFCFPFAAVAAPAVWYLSGRFGYWPSILHAWVGVQEGWLPLPASIGLSGLLLSPGKSFFLYSPPAVLALLSAVAFVRRHGARSVALLAIILFYFGPAYSMKAAWHGGAGWGPRYQVLVLPLVVLVAAPLLQKAIEERHRWARVALLAAFTLGVGLQLLAVSKSFDLYLGLFKYEVVNQLPDQGARYGGADYYPYASGLEEGNAITATLWAWPFSPILAQGWLLSADLLGAGPPALRPLQERLLATPPWRLWGIEAAPAHPEYGLGTDFWSVRLTTDFGFDPRLPWVVLAIVLALEAVVLAAGTRLAAFLFPASRRLARAAWLAGGGGALMLFDAWHLLLR